MTLSAKHVVLLGFKNVGKSVIGKALALRLHRPFIDLDQYLEHAFAQKTQSKLPCRQIMQQHGETFFRDLEKSTLQNAMHLTPAVISLGGGTPLPLENQTLLAQQILVHIRAPKNIVFERIMVKGRPAFFNDQENPLDTFQRLWDEREYIYRTLATFFIENDGSVDAAVEQIIKKLLLMR